MESYFYVDRNMQQAGPVSPDQFAANGVDADTLVWRKGIAEWTRAGDLEELREYFRPAKQSSPKTEIAQPQVVSAGPQRQAPQPQRQAVQPQPKASQAAAPVNAVSQAATEEIPNYLWLAVLSIVFMCSPIGIVAVHHAAKVDFNVLKGNLTEARRRSELAKKWSFIALGISLLWFIFLVATFGSNLLSYLVDNYEFVF